MTHSHWAKIKVWKGCILLGGSRGDSVFRHPHSLAHGPVPPFSMSAMGGWVPLILHHSALFHPQISFPLLPPSPFDWAPCDYTGLNLIVQNNLLILRSLTSSHLQSLFTTEVTYPQVSGIGTWTSQPNTLWLQGSCRASQHHTRDYNCSLFSWGFFFFLEQRNIPQIPQQICS